MDIAFFYGLSFFSVAPSRAGLRFDTVEVWGLSPHEPTIHFNHLRIAGSNLSSQFNTEFNIESVHVWSDDSSGRFRGLDDRRQPSRSRAHSVPGDVRIQSLESRDSFCFILANPPFNDSDWGGESLEKDVRWKYGVPPTGNADFAWVQHFIHHLAPNGVAGFVLANG
jgi:N-6 DNA methylase